MGAIARRSEWREDKRMAESLLFAVESVLLNAVDQSPEEMAPPKSQRKQLEAKKRRGKCGAFPVGHQPVTCACTRVQSS